MINNTAVMPGNAYMRNIGGSGGTISQSKNPQQQVQFPHISKKESKKHFNRIRSEQRQVVNR